MNQRSFKKGEMVLGEVVELILPIEMILQVEGRLIRVKNATYKKVSMGEKIELIVTSVQPLRFELAKRGLQSSHLNVSV